MVHLYRLYSRKPPHLISGLYALCMALYLKRTLNSTLENILHGAVTNLKMMEYLQPVLLSTAILRQPLKRWLISLKNRDITKLHLPTLQGMIWQKPLKMLSDTADLLLLQHLMMVVDSHLWRTSLTVFPTKLTRTVKSESSKMVRGHLLPANVLRQHLKE